MSSNDIQPHSLCYVALGDSFADAVGELKIRLEPVEQTEISEFLPKVNHLAS
jgi:predicted component of type VI protein secretion system